MSETNDLLARNADYVASFDHADLSSTPARRLAVVVCMDVRLDPGGALGLRPGDADIIRNAGGAVTDDVIRSLTISQCVGGTDEIVLVHHTDCALQQMSEDAFRARVEAETGTRPEWPIESFTDPDDNVRRSIARIQASPFLPHKDAVRGFVYHVDTGALREVS